MTRALGACSFRRLIEPVTDWWNMSFCTSLGAQNACMASLAPMATVISWVLTLTWPFWMAVST